MNPIRLLWLVLIFVLGWSAWWGWGAWQAKSGLESWMEDRRADGWQAEWQDIEVRGFPTRIDRTITDLSLANTEGGWAWSAPFFQILGLNYEKDHVILVWPGNMTLQTPWQRIDITGEDLKGSVTFVTGTARELSDATLVFKGLTLASDAGWTSSMDEIRLATRPAEGLDGPRDIGIEIIGLKPRSRMLGRMSDAGIVPGVVDELKADLSVTFDHPWDSQAIEQDRPQPREIEIREIAATWGKLKLRVAGDLSVADNGVVSGDVMVKATNWREILEVARRSGALPAPLADPLESAFTLMSGLTGRSETLDIPVTFSGGRSRIGPVPIGPAPVIRLP